MKNRRLHWILASLAFGWISVAAGPPQVERYILVDQFGYRPGDPKVAVLVDPVEGFNASDAYTPGASIVIRDWNTDETVFSGQAAAWNGGTVQSNSGDRGWWFDFSALTRPGTYYVFDVDNAMGSHPFIVADGVYRGCLVAAVRMFFYQRLAFPKEAAFAGEWTDDAAFTGPGQDTEARYILDRENPALFRDLSGGWMDAGDYNKYVTFTVDAVNQLLTAYEQNREAFTDDFNIPESGNGIPDLVDEIRFELAWMKKMQDVDGGVFIKMGNIDFSTRSPPSTDKRPRYYGPKCSSAAIAASSVFAHAALVFQSFPALAAEAEDLEERAVSAWNWFEANPKRPDCDDQTIKSGDADMSEETQERVKTVAAVYLFGLTGEERYHAAVKAGYRNTRPFQDEYWSMYESSQGDALLYYANLNSADSAVRSVILQKKTREAGTVDIYRTDPALDLYRAFMPDWGYHWGSNNPHACVGNTNMDMIAYNLDVANHARYRSRGLGILHYFHGVNPLGMVYLTNMAAYGAENSATQIWHDWFQYNTPWDKNPAPGYVPGGPNKDYAGPDAFIKRQPPQKAYKDFNDPWPVNSWEITEPAIYYQASYVKLVSKFVTQAVSEDTSTIRTPWGSVGVSPNPFSGSTRIRISLNRGARLRIDVYDVRGRHVRTLAMADTPAGERSVEWEGRDAAGTPLPSGVYVCRFEIDGKASPNDSFKISLMR